MATPFITGYNHIATGLFCRIDCPKYYTSGFLLPQILTFSDWHDTIGIYNLEQDEVEEYLPFGELLQISSLDADLRATSNPITVALSGIPTGSIEEIHKSRLKGSKIQIYRGLFDANTGKILTAVSPNPVGRFSGFITNYSLDETYDFDAKVASNTIVLQCTSNVEFFENKKSGRRTNSESYRQYYDDPSFDRVSELQNTSFDFGSPK